MEAIVHGIVTSLLLPYGLLVLLTDQIIPRIKLKKLSEVYKQDLELYLRTVDKYYKWTLDKVWLNCVRIMKLQALYTTNRRDELEDTIQILNLKKVPSNYVSLCVDFVLNMFIAEEFALVQPIIAGCSKLQISNKKLYRTISLMMAIYQYVGRGYSDSNLLVEISRYVNNLRSDYYMSFIYYFLGIGCMHNGNSEQGKVLLTKASSCQEKTLAAVKSAEMLERE